MFGDHVENMQWDLEYTRRENERLKQLVFQACKVAFEAGGPEVDKTILGILKDAGLIPQ